MIVQLDKAILKYTGKKEEKPVSMTQKMGEEVHDSDKGLMHLEEVMSTHPSDEHRLERLCDLLKKLQKDCVHCNNIEK